MVPETKSRPALVKGKAAITLVGTTDGVSAKVHVYYRLFSDEQPDADGKDFADSLNPNSLEVITAIVEPSLTTLKPSKFLSFNRTTISCPAVLRVSPWIIWR